MNDINTALHPDVRSRGGWAFSAGLLVGLATAIGGIALAVAAERRHRRELGNSGDEATPSSAADSESANVGDWQTEDSELDEELAQTFPASDPLPVSHRVD